MKKVLKDIIEGFVIVWLSTVAILLIGYLIADPTEYQKAMIAILVGITLLGLLVYTLIDSR